MKLPRRHFLHLAAGAAALPACRASRGRKPIRRGRCLDRWRSAWGCGRHPCATSKSNWTAAAASATAHIGRRTLASRTGQREAKIQLYRNREFPLGPQQDDAPAAFHPPDSENGGGIRRTTDGVSI